MVRSEPVIPTAIGLSWATWARIFPPERSTHSRKLRQALVNQLRTGRRLVGLPAGITVRDIAGNGVVREPGELAGSPMRLRQINRFENFHDLLG